jgi:hypothetical protein
MWEDYRPSVRNLVQVRQNQPNTINPWSCHHGDLKLQTLKTQGFSWCRNVLEPFQQEPRQGVMVIGFRQV